MFSFFDEYDFTGKTIVPFVTHYGSGDGGTFRTIAELEPDATVAYWYYASPCSGMDSRCISPFVAS